jgi:hypothetical protein
MDSDGPRKIARNEAIFRDVNEAIESGRWPGERSQVAFRCECAELGCSRLLELTIAAYEHVRGHPRRFIVAQDHQVPGAEEVVETHSDYLVVEKRDEAGTVAEATDPRD